MIQQGHGGLYRYIQRHPKEFGHFVIEEAVAQDKNGHSNFNVSIREEHLTVARQLAQKNDGVLQDTGWLIQHGYTRLASYVKTYPYVFSIRALVSTIKVSSLLTFILPSNIL